jgi:hypothetical protein
LRTALACEAVSERPVGPALYADFTATDEDWGEYRDGWLRPR